MLNGLDLFSGIGGISLALRDWISPMAYCELDPYCQGVLLDRMAKGLMHNAPIWDDIRSLKWENCGFVPLDIIYGGFPCQDISVAGRGKGLEGSRSGLFFEIMRLAKEIKPQFIFLENVPAITSRGGLRVVREIAEMGYDCRWCVISAASIGALHRRERWFLLAHSMQPGRRKDVRATYGNEKKNGTQYMQQPFGLCSEVANTNPSRQSRLSIGAEKERSSPRISGEYSSIDDWKKTVSSVCRITDGLPQRLDRIRALGNSVVPEQAKEAFKILMGIT